MNLIGAPQHYQAKDAHRGYPLGGGYVHPAAAWHLRRANVRGMRAWYRLLTKAGAWKRWRALERDLKRTRLALRSEVERMQQSKNKYRPSRQVMDEYAQVRAQWDQLERELREQEAKR